VELSSTESQHIPDLRGPEMNCIECGQKMFYSEENLVHVCLNDSHGILCYYVSDSCWFAAKEEIALDLSKRGVKFHFIPPSVFQNAGIGAGFACEYSGKKEPTG
jgi:hypothetical protein